MEAEGMVWLKVRRGSTGRALNHKETTFLTQSWWGHGRGIDLGVRTVSASWDNHCPSKNNRLLWFYILTFPLTQEIISILKKFQLS